MPKIIAGKYKNRTIQGSKNIKCRPSTAKFKEAVFSILSSGSFVHNPIIPGAMVLDLFSGTGAYAFETLSRGASQATLIDTDLRSLRVAQDFAQNIKQSQNITIINTNCAMLPKSVRQYNLVFIDPPYHKKLIDKTLNSLIKGNWLENNAILVLEMAKEEACSCFNNFTVLTERIYGNSKLLIMHYVSAL